MRTQRHHRNQTFFQKASLRVALGGFFFAVLAGALCAQRVTDASDSPYVEIDREEGERRLDTFRSQRLSGDYMFAFELEHLPRRGATVRYGGKMWGTWREAGAVTRIELEAGEDPGAGTLELVLWNGPEPRAWRRSPGETEFSELSGDAIFAPILPGVAYSAFDLQMPFIYWENFEYEGPGRVQSRIAQRFKMYPPEHDGSSSLEISSVRLSLDDAYDALLRVEVFAPSGDIRTRMSVESFRKVDGQYIVKEIALKDFASRDRTRFRVVEADVGLEIDPAFFNVAVQQAALDSLQTSVSECVNSCCKDE